METPVLPTSKPLGRVAATLGRLIRARDGVIGVAMALLFVPTVMIVGAAVDYARLEQFKTQLQSTVDSAALSGAAAYITAASSSSASTVANNYLTSNEGLLPSHVGSITTRSRRPRSPRAPTRAIPSRSRRPLPSAPRSCGS